MKKSRISLIASLLLLLSGCQSEDLGNQPVPVGSRSLVATIEGQDYIDASRTAVDDSGNVTWIMTDELGVYGSESANVKYSSTGNGSDVTFTGDLPETEEAKWAYYPYDKDASLDEGTLTITLPDNYTYTGNSNAPMLGKLSGNDKFSFKHLGGLIRFTLGGGIPDDADRFVITSKGENQPIAGQASFAIEGDNVTMSITSDGKQSVSYDVSAIKDAEEFQHFFVPLPVGDYSKLEVSFYKKNSETPAFTRSLSNLKVARAEMICMPILDWNTGKQYKLSENTTDITDLSEGGITVTLKESDNTLQLTGLEEEKVPETGQIIWSQPTAELPYGFMGKVKEVTSSNGTVTITTETVGLDEVFDELLIEEAVDLIPQLESRSSPIDVNKSYKVPIKIQDEGSAYGIEGNLNVETRFLSTIHINKEEKISRMDFSLSLGASFEAAMEVSASFNEDGDEVEPFELKDFNFPPIILGGGVITINPALQFKLHLTPSGKISFATEVDYASKCVAGADYRNGQWSSGINEVNHNEQSPWNMKSSIKMNGELFFGAGVEFKGKLYNRNDLKIYLEPVMGVELSGELEICSEDENLQESLKDFALTTKNVASASFGIDATILNEQAEASFDFKPIEWGEKQLYLLPMFENLTAHTRMMTSGSRASTDPFEATISMTGSRELLSKFMRITTTIVNENDNNDIQYGEYVDYEVIGGGDSSQDFITTFSNLNSDKEYKAYPKISSPILGEELNNEFELTEQNVSFRSPAKDLRDQLIQLYKSAGGDNWTNNENWLSDKPIEEWYGIFETTSGKYGIMLGHNNLTGTVSLSSPDIEMVSLSDNQIENICLAGCSEMSLCEVDNNPLVTLDLSECKNLDQFPYFTDSSCLGSLSSLNIRNCKNIQYVHANLGNSPLKYLNFSGCENLESIAGSGIQWNLMEEVYAKDCTKVSFPNIFIYPCMRVLDVENCVGISSIYSREGAVSEAFSINVKGCKSLTRLECPIGGMIKTLDLTGCENLKHLGCSDNLLTKLDVTNCTLLETLSCGNNNLTELDVTNCTLLTDLSCGENKIEDLDVTNCSSLKNFYCSGNPLTYIDLSRNSDLEILSCGDSEIESLELSSNSMMKRITCNNSKITKLNINNCLELTDLSCYNNQLTILDLKGKSKLETLLCSENPISTLDLSDAQNSLKSLTCDDTEITSINVNNFTVLERVSLSGLTEFYHENCYALKLINIKNTSLTKLDLSNCALLETLSCEENMQLQSLNLSGCTSIVKLWVYNNSELTDLTLMSNAPLRQVNFQKTKVCMEIPSFFPPVNQVIDGVLYCFDHEQRYTNYNRIYDSSTEEWVVTYTDNGYGWWFPGEPDSGKHDR